MTSEPTGSSAVEATDWVSAMRAGDFDRAWAINDQDLADHLRSGVAKHAGPRHQQRIWRGEELRDRRVLVRCYHGLGDTIQFARFLPGLRHRAREVIVWCQPELLPLMEHAEGVDLAVPLHEGKPDVAFDVDIEIMEIPHAIRAGADLIGLRKPYLKLSHGDSFDIGTHPRAVSVGLVWEVGNWDKRRAVPPRLLRRLNCDGIQLYSLQRGPEQNLAAEIGARDISTPDIAALGHRIGQLDVVICVDTMVAHLAGALGHKAWVMLHADCDWRWPASGATSLWYPTVRLFHQQFAGEWSRVVEDLRSALLSWAS